MRILKNKEGNWQNDKIRYKKHTRIINNDGRFFYSN